jgi:hypothetical protein
VRILITRPRRGEIEGVELATFQVGATYDVGSSLAAYLIATKSADPVIDDTSIKPEFSHERLIVFLEKVRAVAADFGRPVDEPRPARELRAESRGKRRLGGNPTDRPK